MIEKINSTNRSNIIDSYIKIKGHDIDALRRENEENKEGKKPEVKLHDKKRVNYIDIRI